MASLIKAPIPEVFAAPQVRMWGRLMTHLRPQTNTFLHPKETVMTSIGPISGSASLTSGATNANANNTPSSARMGVDDLMRVLMTQLTFQDP